ncbi:MAG: TlpA disulfide reductase family protein [Pseudomonadota bacterium]
MKRFWIFILIAGIAIVAMSALQYLNRPKVGEAAPPVELSSVAGPVVSLAEFKGRPVILHFWATFCGACVSEFPSLARLARAFEPEGLAVVAISEDGPNGMGDLRSFLRATEPPFPVLTDLDGRVADTYQSYGVPETFFIDKSGIIAKRINNSVDWDDEGVRAEVSNFILGKQ